MRMDTAATRSGRNASSDAKTKSRTASAPRPPSRVSTSTLLPPDSSPTASASMPVIPTTEPAGAFALTAVSTASVGSSVARLVGNG